MVTSHELPLPWLSLEALHNVAQALVVPPIASLDVIDPGVSPGGALLLLRQVTQAWAVPPGAALVVVYPTVAPGSALLLLSHAPVQVLIVRVERRLAKVLHVAVLARLSALCVEVAVNPFDIGRLFH